MRNLHLIVLIFFCAAAFGCGGPRKAVPVDTLKDRVVGEMVRLEGRLSSRGSTPFPTLVLELDDGGDVVLVSDVVMDDLRRLADMRVAVEGEVSEPLGKRRVLNVLRYDLVRLPSGELPLIGTISVEGEHCMLVTRDARRYWLRGELVGVLVDFAGARVWVTGSLGDPSDAGTPKRATPYWVIGYGVLDEPE